MGHEGMKFTLVVFSCKQYVDIVAVRSSHSTRTVYYSAYIFICLELKFTYGLLQANINFLGLLNCRK